MRPYLPSMLTGGCKMHILGRSGSIFDVRRRANHPCFSYETGVTCRPDVSGDKMGTCAKIKGHDSCTLATPQRGLTCQPMEGKSDG